MSGKIRTIVIAVVVILIVVLTAYILLGKLNKDKGVESDDSVVVESETDIDGNYIVTDLSNTEYEEDYSETEEYVDDEMFSEGDIGEEYLDDEIKSQDLVKIEVKSVSGLQKYGNYVPISTSIDLSDVPSFVGVIEDAEMLYAGTLAENPNISVYVTDVSPEDMYEPYFEALRRCGFSDLHLAKYYGYMCAGAEHTLYMRVSNVTIDSKDGSEELGEMSTVLVVNSVASDVIDKSLAFAGYDLGEFDDLTVIPYE